MRVKGRGYTHSIGARVALRKPSCQFSTGTGKQVSLMVSWQRRDRRGPLSSSSWALLWTVSTREGGGGAEGQRWGFEVESHVGRYGNGRPREEERKKTRKTQKHMKQEQLTWDRNARAQLFVIATASQSYTVISARHQTVWTYLTQRLSWKLNLYWKLCY